VISKNKSEIAIDPMKHLRFCILALAFFLPVLAAGSIARANCSNPTSVAGRRMYNTTYRAMQYCNGANWQAIGNCLPASSNGTGYFVLTSTTYNGNLGGLSGADAKCLTELTTNTNWMGYSTANGNGQLVASKVHAFLSLQTHVSSNLMPLTTYYFANAANSAAGGASFTTDANGAGPGDAQNWSAASYFSGTYNFWSGRADNAGHNTATLWYTQASNYNDCTGWTDGTSGAYGDPGATANTDQSRWGLLTYNVTTCDNTYHLVCFVNP
jgi:hypothetical protein